jgi:hypothetical protein
MTKTLISFLTLSFMVMSCNHDINFDTVSKKDTSPIETSLNGTTITYTGYVPNFSGIDLSSLIDYHQISAGYDISSTPRPITVRFSGDTKSYSSFQLSFPSHVMNIRLKFAFVYYNKSFSEPTVKIKNSSDEILYSLFIPPRHFQDTDADNDNEIFIDKEFTIDDTKATITFFYPYGGGYNLYIWCIYPYDSDGSQL